MNNVDDMNRKYLQIKQELINTNDAINKLHLEQRNLNEKSYELQKQLILENILSVIKNGNNFEINNYNTEYDKDGIPILHEIKGGFVSFKSGQNEYIIEINKKK